MRYCTTILVALMAIPLAARAAEQLSAPRSQVDQLYAHRTPPLWGRNGAARGQPRAVIELLRNATRYGLRPEDYSAPQLGAALEQLSTGATATAAQWSQFDRELSVATLRFLHDIHFGRIEPRVAHFNMPERHEDPGLSAAVDELAAGADPAQVVARLEPNFVHYRLLREALARYRELAARVPDTPLPAPPRHAVRPGQPYAGLTALRHRLAALGDLPDAQAGDESQVLDAPLASALKAFQLRHGLRTSGELDAATWQALQVPLAERVRQIELTLERWRWVPNLGPPTLMVNIPQFRLFLYRSATDVEGSMLRMDVIVGRAFPQLHTPIFAADMTAVLFRPYWDVPPSIVRREILPLLRRKPDYLARQDMELVPSRGPATGPLPATSENLRALAAGQLRLRQRPGPENALGLIKFVLPNPYDVYLHSTPAQGLFAQARRAFSHGCIRVSDPVALATEALRGTREEWTREKIRAAMDGDATFQVRLAQPIHVLILYGTAVATEDGGVRFFEDIYGEDRRLEALLGLAPVRARP